MSFWNIKETEVTGSYVQETGGNFDPIPHGTDVYGFIDAIKWAADKTDGSKPIEYRFNIVKPAALKDRKLFFKFYLLSDNPNKQGDKKVSDGKTHQRKFFNIDKQIANGALLALNRIPTDEELQGNLMNKMIAVKIGMYDMPKDDGTGERNKGNYLLGPLTKGVDIPENVAMPVANTQTSSQGGTSRVDDDELPF